MGANPLGIDGIAFIEVASITPSVIEAMLSSLGFSRTHEHSKRDVDLYCQNDCSILLTREHGTHAHGYAEEHGPALTGLGLRAQNPHLAHDLAVRLGATGIPRGLGTSIDAPAVLGPGGRVVYFVSALDELVPHRDPLWVPSSGLSRIDHVNIGAARWSRFYRELFECRICSQPHIGFASSSDRFIPNLIGAVGFELGSSERLTASL